MTPYEKVEKAQQLLKEVQIEVKSQEFKQKDSNHEFVYAAISSFTSEIEETEALFYKMKLALSYIPATTKNEE